METFSNSRLYKIAKENYIQLTQYCKTLVDEGYWERPESVLNKSIIFMLDLYVQSVLVNLAVYSDTVNEDTNHFIGNIASDNVMRYPESEAPSTELLAQANKIMMAPPIILQLCGLRDSQKQTNLTPVFFDGIMNIMLAMAYLNDGKNMSIIKYMQEYYQRVSVFLDQSPNGEFTIDDKYIFRKICSDQIEAGLVQIRSNQSNLENYLRKNTSVKQEINLSDHKIERSDKNHKRNEIEKSQEKLDLLLDELNKLVGLSNVKEEINSLINLIKVRKMREEYGMPQMEMSFHMVFTGNPGTGKTTVARLVAEIYKEIGLLSKGNLIETDRGGLVAGYVGQTALKVKEVVDKAIGGVLFIDEAYSLTNNIGSNDFGSEAIDTLVKMMEDHREDLVVIVAGYKKEMEQFLVSNTGLVSRFNKFFEFVDYNTEELIDILCVMAEKVDMILCDEAIEKIRYSLDNMTKSKKKVFGNARGIRNVFEKIIVNQANRIVISQDSSKESLKSIALEDVEGTF